MKPKPNKLLALDIARLTKSNKALRRCPGDAIARRGAVCHGNAARERGDIGLID
jgi:hypothetical protein